MACGREAEAARKRVAEEAARRTALSRSSSAVETRLRPPLSNTLADLHRIADLFDPTNAEPSVEEWEQYIASIKNYDERHPNTFALSVGLVNEGDAPAHDILVDFWFPEGVIVNDSEPRAPARPLRNRTLILDSLLPRGYEAVEVNSSLRVNQHETGTRAHLKIKRLMHSMQVAYPVWVEVLDPSVRGMKINARVLSASPPIEEDVGLNVRWAVRPRGATS